MSRGKYSLAYQHRPDGYEYRFNCYGQEPEPWTQELHDAGIVYDEKTMFGDYDEDGYDWYGYSGFDADGNYVGCGNGIDRAGWTEHDYLTLADLSPSERETYYD